MTAIARRTILELAVEDEYGLWELVWRLKTSDPSYTDENVVKLASATVTSLLGDGLVRLYVRKSGESAVPVHDDDALSVLGIPLNWTEPAEGGAAVLIAATPSGEVAYYGR